mmetsp:Transcript_54280/g.140159  ORF Transcript_54280/g.140159 Transcript_54280/m.140159 type:complete len:220 (+) Transcript_54280:233-892(+)
MAEARGHAVLYQWPSQPVACAGVLTVWLLGVRAVVVEMVQRSFACRSDPSITACKCAQLFSMLIKRSAYRCFSRSTTSDSETAPSGSSTSSAIRLAASMPAVAQRSSTSSSRVSVSSIHSSSTSTSARSGSPAVSDRIRDTNERCCVGTAARSTSPSGNGRRRKTCPCSTSNESAASASRKHARASLGVSTIGIPAKLNDVFMTIGTPSSARNAAMRAW